MSAGWVLAFVLTVVLPDGRIAEQRGRDNRDFALEACLDELQRFHAGQLPAAAPGARVVGVQAACVPEARTRDPVPEPPRPRRSGRDYAA